MQEELVLKLDPVVQPEMVDKLQMKVQGALRCTEKEDQEEIAILRIDAQKDLLDAHEKRTALLENIEELELKLHENARKLHEEVRIKIN